MHNSLSPSFDKLTDETVIALVGKYTKFEDSYASVIKALKHASLAANRKLILKVQRSANTHARYTIVNIHIS